MYWLAIRFQKRVTFTLRAGETLALLGESGCGKTTTGKALLRLIDGARISGRAMLQGQDLLTADRVWLNRFTGEGPKPMALDERPYERFDDLRAARVEEDERFIRFTRSLTPDAIEQPFTYSPVSSPEIVTQKLWPALTHVFNHQTHHRGQVHAGLTGMGKPSLSLDLIYFVRGEGKAWM